MDGFLIREATPQDVFGISVVEKSCFSVPTSKELFDAALAHPDWHYFVIEYEKKIVGYCGIYLILDEGQIGNIGILPEFRSRGFGLALMDHIISFCEKSDIKTITLEVRESNMVARNLYTKLGFVIVGSRRNYYVKPVENAILMDKKLD